jgi:hypothetical protein
LGEKPVKRFCYAAVFCIFLISPALGQSKPITKKTEPRPIALSDWIRHVGLHYLDLVGKTLDPTLSSEEHTQYNRFLDDEEASLNIDARGADRLFVESVLKQVRKLSVDFIGARAYRDEKPDAYERRLKRLASCKATADVAISDGTLQPKDVDECTAATVPYVPPA